MPLTFASDTPALCTVADATVTLLAIGTCVLRAAQAGDQLYEPAADVTQPVEIAKPPKQQQTIYFAPISEKTLGAAPFAVTLEASSNLPVALSSNTLAVCQVDGITVSLVATGLCTLTAVQAGDDNFRAAETVTQSFGVNVLVPNTGRVYLPLVAN